MQSANNAQSRAQRVPHAQQTQPRVPHGSRNQRITVPPPPNTNTKSIRIGYNSPTYVIDIGSRCSVKIGSNPPRLYEFKQIDGNAVIAVPVNTTGAPHDQCQTVEGDEPTTSG